MPHLVFTGPSSLGSSLPLLFCGVFQGALFSLIALFHWESHRTLFLNCCFTFSQNDLINSRGFSNHFYADTSQIPLLILLWLVGGKGVLIKQAVQGSPNVRTWDARPGHFDLFIRSNFPTKASFVSAGVQNYLNLHRTWSQSCNLFLHTVANPRIHCGSSREDVISVEILTDVDIAFHNTVVSGFVDTCRFHP